MHRMRQPQCATTTLQCDLPQNEKCNCVDARCSMLTADPTCAVCTYAIDDVRSE